MKSGYCWLLAAAALWAVACPGPGGPQNVLQSEGVRPEWLQQCPAPDDRQLCFCGEARGQPGMEQACAAAYADALGKLTRSLGQKVQVAAERVGDSYQLTVSSSSEPLVIKGLWEDQRWYEQSRAGTGVDCWVMLVYPRLEYDLAQRRIGEAAQALVRRAGELHAEGGTLLAASRTAEAAERLRRAQALLESLKEPLIEGEMNSTLLLEQVRADLRRAEQLLGNFQRTAVLVLRVLMDGKEESEGTLGKQLAALTKRYLSEKGLQLVSGQLSQESRRSVLEADANTIQREVFQRLAGWLVIVDLNASFLTQEGGIFFCQGQGQVRLINSADGREVAAELGPRKEGHPFSRQAALERSIKMMAEKELGDKLGRLLGSAGGR
jgi:hypothetical protein